MLWFLPPPPPTYRRHGSYERRRLRGKLTSSLASRCIRRVVERTPERLRASARGVESLGPRAARSGLNGPQLSPTLWSQCGACKAILLTADSSDWAVIHSHSQPPDNTARGWGGGTSAEGCALAGSFTTCQNSLAGRSLNYGVIPRQNTVVRLSFQSVNTRFKTQQNGCEIGATI